ncbi:MAG: hypothetical protein ACFFDN_47710 [Candidatus Hodarchaeota archaeon]
MDYMTEILKLRKELDALPEKGKFDLGGKGIELLTRIHRLECKLERKIRRKMGE